MAGAWGSRETEGNPGRAGPEMDLGQSTVLGLAIVGDDGGVDEAEYHKVSGCERSQTAAALCVCPMLRWTHFVATAAAGGRGGKSREAGECRGGPGDGEPGQQEEQGMPGAISAAFPCACGAACSNNGLRSVQPAFQALTTVLLEAAKFNAGDEELKSVPLHFDHPRTLAGNMQHRTLTPSSLNPPCLPVLVQRRARGVRARAACRVLDRTGQP